MDWPYGLDGDLEIANRLEEIFEHLALGLRTARELRDWVPFMELPDRNKGRPLPFAMQPFDEKPHLTPWQRLFWGLYGPETRKKQYEKNERLSYAWRAHHSQWTQKIDDRKALIDAFDERIEVLTREANVHNNSLSLLQASALDGDRDACWKMLELRATEYLARTMGSALYRIGVSHDSKRVVLELEVPRVSVVPREKSARRLKTTGEIRYAYRTDADVRRIYTNYLAQIALACLSAFFDLSEEAIVETAVVNLFTIAPDPATGQVGETTLLSVMATRTEIEAIDLKSVDPVSCIRHLSATVSRSPAEVVPVKPLATVDKTDERFVADADVLSDLDHCPNLMELSPTEFEGLVQNLFAKMGLDTKQTRASRDGGVDAIAFDPRPIIGGKIVIQAKRYKNIVGVSAVRDLFGTLQNEGGSKGILVTTSGYGKASFEFAKNKPLELIDGAGLLFLLREHAGIDARIVVPQDWLDPTPD